MSTIRIGNDERPLESADMHWITQQIQARRSDGRTVCVKVIIRTRDLDLALATPTCGGGGGGGRPPTQREKAVIDLWNELGLNSLGYEPGKVVAFVQRVRKFL